MPIVSEILSVIGPMVGDSAVCPDSEDGKQRIIEALNLAQEALIKRLDAKGTLWFYELPVSGGCFPLPSDVLEIRSAWLDGKSLQLRDEWWEGKLSVGLQDATCPWRRSGIIQCGNADLIDLGDGYATPTPWPDHANVKLALVADNESDAGQIVQVRVIDEYNNEQEEFITLLGDLQPAISVNHVRQVTLFRKPVTKGGVKLYVYYDANGLRTSHAYYQPRTTMASFRRKKINDRSCCGCLLIKAKRRFIPILYETDPLQISDTAALRWAVQAIAAQERKSGDEYNQFMALAVNELNRQLSDATSAGASGQIQWRSPFGSALRNRAWS